ncbi:TetR/AcrR family transcriptional regulator [Konateibacter massiliensis]|uniref:TetR/AcrR family transcriptional regulator n=1 Tax=Konateibacter massiliensis TaxID=2002841 RepID=UPI000C158AE2|nr:TetR/AcrR family transcriptional regulator [Konateibacter massiliensis]
MNKYDITTQKKKDDIIKASLHLFHRQGFSATTMSDIARQADVSKASIYNYFGSKEALVGECAVLLMKDTMALAEEILASDDTYIHKLLNALNLCNNQLNKSVSAFISEEVLKDRQFVDLVTNNINTLKKDIYIKYIDEGKREGVIDSNISNNSIELFIDSINHMAAIAVNQHVEFVQEEIVNLFLYGIIGKNKV